MGGALELLGPRRSRGERRAEGRSHRTPVPRREHALWEPPSARVDPIDLLERTNAKRVPELVPIRYGRMLASPFTYLRGSPVVMASDFATTATTGMEVQICGDAHLLNFGVFASPERHLLFDVNDFDETAPGPWEWDLKRLVVSMVVAGRDNGFSEQRCAEAARATARSYRLHIREYAQMGNLDVWYSKVEVDEVLERIASFARETAREVARKARRRTSERALPKLTEVVNGERRFIDNPPVIEHVKGTLGGGVVVDLEEGAELFDRYLDSLSEERRTLLERYRFVDLARKVVGVGSVGTRCSVMLLVGMDGHDPLFLQIKEAQESVIEPYWRPSPYACHAQRVVVGQRLMQAAGDIFLGWASDDHGHDFYFRQLRDMKGSVDVSTVSAEGLVLYGELCAWALARTHARSADIVPIAGYLGKGDSFDAALAKFARRYADQNERDYEHMAKAVRKGRIAAETGI